MMTDFSRAKRFELANKGVMGRYVEASQYGGLLQEFQRLNKAFDELIELAKNGGDCDVCQVLRWKRKDHADRTGDTQSA